MNSEQRERKSELWDNPLIPIEERLQIADGAVKFRDGVIENLRAQLADARAALSTEAQPERKRLANIIYAQGEVFKDKTKWAQGYRQACADILEELNSAAPPNTEAQPEVTGAVAYLDYNGVLKPTRDGVVSMKKGDNLYPPSAIQAAVREKLEEAAWACKEYAVKKQSKAANECAKLVLALMESPQQTRVSDAKNS